ncbi:MAG: hypothetical protein HY554_18675 [Elusimicrobia bacterium]|nr:hypothetical protein [Elusimicrobiota bacterium]
MRRFLLLSAALASSACQEPAPEPEAAPAAPSAGARPAGAPSGGDVAFAPRLRGRELEEKVERALARMRAADYDGAYEELGEALAAGRGPAAERAARELEQVQARLLAIPPVPAGEVVSQPARFLDRPVSLRGRFAPGGSAGSAGQYFWLLSGRERVQCRYHRLHADAKKAALGLAEGTGLLVRGKLRSAGASSYLDLVLFRIERS